MRWSAHLHAFSDLGPQPGLLASARPAEPGSARLCPPARSPPLLPVPGSLSSPGFDPVTWPLALSWRLSSLSRARTLCHSLMCSQHLHVHARCAHGRQGATDPVSRRTLWQGCRADGPLVALLQARLPGVSPTLKTQAPRRRLCGISFLINFLSRVLNLMAVTWRRSIPRVH